MKALSLLDSLSLSFLVIFPSLSFGKGVTKELTSAEFFEGIVSGRFDAVVDVRREDEWKEGHIANATFVENLASDGSVDALLGCEDCSIAVYCRSGARAGGAIERLRNDLGFNGDLYNGLGVKQWKEEGFGLVQTDSVEAPCNVSNEYVCKDCYPDCSDTIDGQNLKEGDSSVGGENVSKILLSVFFVIAMWNGI